MKPSNLPATHTGRIHTSGIGTTKGTVKVAKLIQNRLTWRDVETGQLYSKVTGCVRPCNVWDRRCLDTDTVAPINPEG